MSKVTKKINADLLLQASEIMRAISHPLRLKIIQFIDQHGSIHVNKIYNNLKLEQSITSQHLRILRSAGLVDTVKEGKFRHYHLNYGQLGKVKSALNNFYAEE